MTYGCNCGAGGYCRCNTPRPVGQPPPPESHVPIIFIVGLALLAAALLGGEQKKGYRS
jgi:hypothetical protein